MKGLTAYVLRTGRRLEPFGKPVDRVRIHGMMVRDHRRRALGQLGMREQVIDDLDEVRPPCVLTRDDLYLTPHALAGFIRTVREAGPETKLPRISQAALVCSAVTERFLSGLHESAPLEMGGEVHRRYPLYFIHGSRFSAGALDPAQPVPIPYRHWRISRVANPFFEPSGRYEVPVSLVYLLVIRHWSQILAANLQGLPGHLLHSALERKLDLLRAPLALPWRAGSLRPTRMRGVSYLKGTGCRVDPSAHVEMSVLGDKVRIGPNAVVRNCVVGSRVEIGAGAVVEASSLGPRTVVNSNVTVRCCSVDREVSIGVEFVQWSVLGAGSVICPVAGFFDFSLNGDVEVELDGKSVPSGDRILGSCLGEKVFLGPLVAVNAGTAIPNKQVLIRDPRRLVRRAGRKLPEDIWRIDGRG